ncbi:ABC drug exporter AtrF [Chaetomium sp. MPI-SDFR-AT-0129]|nr:ABC drug exporter AtrF [Chaetomium sp. MPI-SDFR-AT-0129]
MSLSQPVQQHALPPPTRRNEWRFRPGSYTPRDFIREIALLLESVIVQLGPDGPEDADSRAILMDGLRSSLSHEGRETTLPLADWNSEQPSDLTRHILRIGKALYQYAAEANHIIPGDPSLTVYSPCEGHKWVPPAGRLLRSPRSSPILMMLYNEWLHQITCLRDILIGFDNFEDVILNLDHPVVENKSSRPVVIRASEEVDLLALLGKLEVGGVHLGTEWKRGTEAHSGVDSESPRVAAPDPGLVTVKTLPKAIINTFGPDQTAWLVQNLFKPLGLVKPPKNKTILHNFTGLVRPGEMLLVLGRPGSGCSTFLRTAANRSALKVTGELQYAGLGHEEFYKKHRRETLYLPEEDKHIPTLTVRQTLEFALRMSLSTRERKTKDLEKTVKEMAAMFGLEHALDTIVGGGAVRGVSGGEKKRVSIAEVLASGSSVQCFDNSTRGLDSSTALDFVKALRTLTDLSQKTTLATLYQAGENIYRHFDKVILLDSGYEIYFGPVDKAQPYFEALGFVSDPRQTTSEFLTTVTDPAQRQVRTGSTAETLRTPKDLADAFRSSKEFSQLQSELSDLDRSYASQPDLVPTSPIKLSYPSQVWECLRREVQLINGRRAVYYQKWINTVVLCLIVGSEYFNISSDASGAFTRQGVIFYAIIANAWMQYPELFDAHSNRAVLERQSSVNMYRSSAVAVARILIDIPMIALQHAFFMIAYYFLAHHTVAYTAGDFFYFYLVLCLSTINFANLLRMFAYYVPSVEDCFRIGGIASTTTVYFAGFLIPINRMRPVWSWLHYISPPRYSYEALLTNELHRLEISCGDQLLPNVPGANLSHQVCPVRGAEAGQDAVPGLQYVGSLGFNYANRWRNVGILIGFAAAYMLVGVIGSEIMHFTSQGGAPVVFARRDENRKGENGAAADVEKSAALGDSGSSSTESYRGKPSLVWSDVTVDIGDKRILHGVTGYVRPGELVALCGSSGAGKTTLLTHLTQTNPVGVSGGQLEFGNKPLGRYFKKMSGFAQQSDMHDGTATIREALEFSALLRQPSIYSRAEKLAYVDHVLEILDLTHLQHALIGDADSGLGVELTKRVTIAVELVARPQILFADEPTSGLDSQGAAAIVSYLKRLAQQGQAVLVTIHQPSASLFRVFDKVVALSSGGQQIYYGSVDNVLPYITRISRTEHPEDANPAEVLLETIGSKATAKDKPDGLDWTAKWKESPEAEAVQKAIAEIKKNEVQWDRAEQEQEFNTSSFSQTIHLTKRMLLNQWRKPAYIYSKIWVHTIQAILIGFTFFQLGTSPLDLQSRAFGAFALIFLVNTIVNPILARFFGQRLLWEVREGPSRTYGWLALCNASFLAELPAIGVTGVLYYLLWYFLTGLPLGEAAGYTFLIVMIYEVFEMSFGLLVTAVSPDLKFAGLVLVFLVTIFNWFNGVVVPYQQIQGFWRYWLYYLNPLTYLFGGMIIAADGAVDVVCDEADLFSFPPPKGQSCGAYAGDWAVSVQANLTNPLSRDVCHVCQYTKGTQYLEQFGLQEGRLGDNMWAYLGVFVLFTVVNVVLFYFFTWATRVKRWKVFYFF